MINKNKETEGRLKFGHLNLKRESLSGICWTCCQDKIYFWPTLACVPLFCLKPFSIVLSGRLLNGR